MRGDGDGKGVEYLHPGISIEEIEGKGRGVVTSEPVAAGEILVNEAALASTFVKPDEDDPVAIAAALVAAVLEGGLEPAVRHLTPRPGSEFLTCLGRNANSEELARGRILVRSRGGGSAEPPSDDDIDRLQLVVRLNAISATPPGGRKRQGLFPEFGAMFNHNSCPNVLWQGVVKLGKLSLNFRAARDIEAGEELTVSYLEPLYLSYPERCERLREHFFFTADMLPTDYGLEALAEGVDATDQQGLLSRIVAVNEMAHDAWERVREVGREMKKLEDDDCDTDNSGSIRALASEQRRQRMLAAKMYRELLDAGLLAETHAWRYNASWRLAALLTTTSIDAADDVDAEEAAKEAACAKALICSNALPLWQSALRCGDLVFPSDYWPERRPLLCGARDAAASVGDEQLRAAYASQIAELERVLGLDER